MNSERSFVSTAVEQTETDLLHEVSAENAVDYLRSKGRIPREVSAKATELGGGVSNAVLRIDAEGRPPFVLKQARERLRTAKEWRCPLDRIRSEIAALKRLAPLNDLDASVPIVLFQEADDYLFAMSHAPEGSIVWKELLLAGRLESKHARIAGEALGRRHAADLCEPLGPLHDWDIFDRLRIDPYYRAVARVHPAIAEPIGRLIDSLKTDDRAFVHADYSPKNILIHSNGLFVVDFETAHIGDPAFDLGFFNSHLLLKSIRAGEASGSYLALIFEFLEGYRSAARSRGAAVPAEREARAIRHASACCLARVDGKSPVDYLDENRRAIAREFALETLADPPDSWESLTAALQRNLNRYPRER